MKSTDTTQAGSRASLSRAILEVLQSWPSTHRQIFSQAHYSGRKIEEIAGSLDLTVREVRQILENCDRRLRAGLRKFRRVKLHEPTQSFSAADPRCVGSSCGYSSAH